MPTSLLAWDTTSLLWRIGNSTVAPPPPPPDTSFVLRTTKPDATNTGVGIIAAAPTAVVGSQTITVAGTVLENKIITGQVIIKAANVTIRNCIIKGNSSLAIGTWLVLVVDAAATGARIEYCELESSGFPQLALNGIGSKNYTSYRNHVHDVVDGFSIYNTSAGGADAFVQGCYMHANLWINPDPTGDHADGTHDDGLQVQGSTNIQVVGNTIMGVESPISTAGYDGWATSAIMINHNVGDPTAMSIEDNWLGGGGYSINGLGSYTGMNISIVRNKFDTASAKYGPIGYKIGTGNTWNVPTSGADANVDLNGNSISVYTVA